MFPLGGSGGLHSTRISEALKLVALTPVGAEGAASEVMTFTAVLEGPGATVTATTDTLYSVNAESPPIVIEVSLVELVVLSPGEPLG